MMKYLFAIALSFLSFSAFAKSADSINVYFPLNNASISTVTTHTIDSLIYNDVLIPGQKLTIFGYADYLGGVAYNDSLSLVRARNIKKYLVAAAFDKKDIQLCIGKGKIERKPVNGKAGFPDDRKVQIIIDKHIAAPPVVPTPKPAPMPPAKPQVDITQLKVNETLALDNIYFYPGSHKVTPSSAGALEKLYEVLNTHKDLKIQIEGHLCCELSEFRGRHYDDAIDYDDNTMTLSVNRAKAIYRVLIEKGIEPGRLKYIGLGWSSPSVKLERTEEDQDRDRRVEIRILKK